MRQEAARLIRALAVIALAAVAIAGSAVAQPKFPALTGRVVDQANVLSAATRAELVRLFEDHERATSNQVVVATVATLQGYDIADFGVQLGRAWKLGQGDRNNGVLLLVAPNDRQVRIEVGYGLEGSLPDALAFQIIQAEILPRFRANDINGGVLAGARAVLGAIAGTYKAKPRSPLGDIDPEFVIFLMIAAFIVVASMQSRYRRSPYGHSHGQSYGGGSSGGGSGGGFSGGGGSFGGGGASGKW